MASSMAEKSKPSPSSSPVSSSGTLDPNEECSLSSKDESIEEQASPAIPLVEHIEQQQPAGQVQGQRFIVKRRPSPLFTPPGNYSDWLFFSGLLLITILSTGTRLYCLSEPNHVAWDETHFGKHASWYIQGKFFFDVHPPLGKLIIATAGVLSGYNGSFEFKEPGQKYEDTPYVGMRLGCVLFGILLAPLSYLIVWELVNSISAALLAGLMVICETGTLTLTQYILLDPPLMFFVMASTFCAVKFRSFRNEPFGLEWWYFMSLTGVFLACTFSVKWVGLFVIFLVGLMTIRDLWDLLGDIRLPMSGLVKHFLARSLCLIFVPMFIYTSIFALHLLALRYSGNGDGFFSSQFQATLEGNELYDQKVPEFLAYGSVITLKNHRGGGGLLHSHSHLYPEDVSKFKQQQVTAYSHKDDNNKWIVRKPFSSQNITNTTTTGSGDGDAEEEEVEFVLSGNKIVLEHLSTHRNLHSHPEEAPITKTHKQVTGYGESGLGDSNDYWEVEVVRGQKGDKVKTVISLIRLRHVNLACYLHSHGKQLPKWGWEQLEVSCNPKASDPNNLWNIEGNINDKLPMVSFEFYKPSFISRFIESHIVMAESNNNMKPKEGEITSQPWQWPLNWQGQLFSGGDYRVYLLGNPIIFWGSDVTLVIFLMMLAVKLFTDQRAVDLAGIAGPMDHFVSAGLFLVLGWALHYFPFFLMGRVLYFHHYFPALMYIIMLGAIVAEFCIQLLTGPCRPSMKPVVYYSGMVLVYSVVIGSFVMFSPLSYGMTGSKADNPDSSMHGLKWLSTWDI